MPTASNSVAPRTDARILELDGLRGIAIGMVLVWHLYFGSIEAVPATVLSYIHATGRLAWSGVDLFFVLSGFLIGGILLDNRDASNYFRVFYTRRFFRIVPAYFASVIVFYIFVRLIEDGPASRFNFLLGLKVLPWIPHVFFLQNFWMAAENATGVLVITWSLCIEEQFYLTLPILVRFLSAKRLLGVTCSVIFLAPVLRLTLMLVWPGHRWAAFVLLPTRADTLMLGVLGAIAIRNPRWRLWLANNPRRMRLLLALFAAGILSLLKYSWFYTGFGMQAVGYTCLAVFYLCVLLYAVIHGGPLRSFLRWKPLVRLGTLAYGVYLYHMLVIWLLFGSIYSYWPRIKNLQSLIVSLSALLAIWILAELSWRYFEKPLVKVGQRARYHFALSPTTTNLSPSPAGASLP